MRIAVIGGGAAGLSTAWLLSRHHETVLFEAADYLGGHAHTIDIKMGGRRLPVDTGFIVYNEPNYPNLTRLFEAIDVPTQASDMSFSVSLGGGRVEYLGSLLGLFAQPGNLCRPDHWRMLRDIRRFYSEVPRLLDAQRGYAPSLGQVLGEGGYSQAFAQQHLLPMAAAIWSSTLKDILAFPARSFVQFFVNHGLLDLKGRPNWRTVRGGSREYVARLLNSGRFEARTRTPVQAITRTPTGVLVRMRGRAEERFDQVVLATPANRALEILGAGASALERRLLGAFRYQANHAVVHCDPRLMPRRRRVWASWNYMAEDHRVASERVSVSYWMNRLQNLPIEDPVIVSLNPLHEPASQKTFAELVYMHPQFDQAAIDAQTLLSAIQGGNRTWFCGSYCGYGFHEDAVQSGVAVAAVLGAPAPWAKDVTPRSPAVQAVREPRAEAAE